MKEITKIEVRNLVKELNNSIESCIGFAIINDAIEMLYPNKENEVKYRIDGYIARWKSGEDTFQETIIRVHDYMCEVIKYHNEENRN